MKCPDDIPPVAAARLLTVAPAPLICVLNPALPGVGSSLFVANLICSPISMPRVLNQRWT